MTDKTEWVMECARRLVEHADFKLGGCLSAESKARDIPSNAVAMVKSRHLASLRDALAAASTPPVQEPDSAIAAGDGTLHGAIDQYAARHAAAWAREQALEHAEQACATLPRLHPLPLRFGDAVAMTEEHAYATGIAKCIKAIRALKGKP